MGFRSSDRADHLKSATYELLLLFKSILDNQNKINKKEMVEFVF
jgi:hypothetical protein